MHCPDHTQQQYYSTISHVNRTVILCAGEQMGVPKTMRSRWEHMSPGQDGAFLSLSFKPDRLFLNAFFCLHYSEKLNSLAAKERSFTVKMFTFQFFTLFSSLFYVAFFLGRYVKAGIPCKFKTQHIALYSLCSFSLHALEHCKYCYNYFLTVWLDSD